MGKTYTHTRTNSIVNTKPRSSAKASRKMYRDFCFRCVAVASLKPFGSTSHKRGIFDVARQHCWQNAVAEGVRFSYKNNRCIDWNYQSFSAIQRKRIQDFIFNFILYRRNKMKAIQVKVKNVFEMIRFVPDRFRFIYFHRWINSYFRFRLHFAWSQCHAVRSQFMHIRAVIRTLIICRMDLAPIAEHTMAMMITTIIM